MPQKTVIRMEKRDFDSTWDAFKAGLKGETAPWEPIDRKKILLLLGNLIIVILTLACLLVLAILMFLFILTYPAFILWFYHSFSDLTSWLINFTAINFWWVAPLELGIILLIFVKIPKTPKSSSNAQKERE